MKAGEFPKKLAFFAFFSTLVFMVSQLVMISRLGSLAEEMHSVHFPLLERMSISVQMQQQMVQKLDQAITTRSSEKISEYLLFLDAFKDNLEISSRLASKISEDQRFNFLSKNAEILSYESRIVQALENKRVNEARGILQSVGYKQASLKFETFVLEVTEELATVRDQKLEESSKRLAFGTVLSFIALGLIVTFWFYVMRAYRANLLKRREAETELEEERVRLVNSSKLATLGEMAGGIAHEINNPLAIIEGYAGRLNKYVEDEKSDPKMLQQIAERITGTTQRIAKIVKGLKNFSRDGSNDPFEECFLHEIINDAFGLCSERVRNDGIALEMIDIPQNLSIIARPVQLSQVLVNFINNARDALTESDVPNKRITVSVDDKGETIEVHVRDNGPGIPEQVQDKILQPFFTTKEVGKGTGLGLSISFSIAKDHGGSLLVQSQPGRTQFTLLIKKIAHKDYETPPEVDAA